MDAEVQDFAKKNVILFVAVVYLLTYALNLYVYLQGGAMLLRKPVTLFPCRCLYLPWWQRY
jgi:hypothetical protein